VKEFFSLFGLNYQYYLVDDDHQNVVNDSQLSLVNDGSQLVVYYQQHFSFASSTSFSSSTTT
jgi:hypothetical protein